MDIFQNLSGSPITATVKIVGNLGSGTATTVFNTSDGDTTVEVTDQWIGTDDADGTGTPAIIHYIHGPTGIVPATTQVIGDNIEWTYNLTVPANSTVRLASFTVLNATQAGVEADVNVLVTPTAFGGQAGTFLTQAELNSLVNFQFNIDPVADAGGPYTVGEGGSVVLTGAASADVDGTIELYEWDLDNNGSYEVTGMTPTFSAATIDGDDSRIVDLGDGR